MHYQDKLFSCCKITEKNLRYISVNNALKNIIFAENKIENEKDIWAFAMLFLLTGCDDGDITFKSFNFTNATAQACTNSGIIYKVQGSEALLLQLAPNTLINAENKNEVGDDIPRMITLEAQTH
ncbi:hypothetical protein LRS05_16380 [Flavobacterium sp. J372]|uniref:hypothetical protein n=1 Tax=Flavobacterium sp. J372 TaxID=2898436 RepID=UPI0021506CDB|nr:hypothetical protein [Flavobacterium sp. J372]MCR5863588.1 hypothetical protein [Flavobacterium sp. J372]